MKNILIYLLVFIPILSCNKHEYKKVNCNNSFIVAVDSLNVCNEIVKIDTIIVTKNYETPEAAAHCYYDLDLNNDQIADIQFSTYYNESSDGAAVEFGCSIYQKDDSLEFLAGTDESYLAIKNLDDTIGFSNNWKSKDMIKLSYGYFENCPPMCPGLTVQINRDLQNKYLGFRMKTPSLINYFWIRFNIISFNKLIVKEIGRTTNY